MAVPLQEGRSLRDALRASPAPSEVWLKGLLAPLLHALTALHGANVHSCDITPDTILLREDDSPLLVDLGLTRRIIAKATMTKPSSSNPVSRRSSNMFTIRRCRKVRGRMLMRVAAVIHLAITGKASCHTDIADGFGHHATAAQRGQRLL